MVFAGIPVTWHWMVSVSTKRRLNQGQKTCGWNQTQGVYRSLVRFNMAVNKHQTSYVCPVPFHSLYLALPGLAWVHPREERTHIRAYVLYTWPLNHFWPSPPTPLEHGKNTVFFDLFSRIGLKGKAVVETQRVVTMVNANCWLRIVEYRPPKSDAIWCNTVKIGSLN